MSRMMKCFVMHGIGRGGVMDKPVPRLGPNDAIIRTTTALISFVQRLEMKMSCP